MSRPRLENAAELRRVFGTGAPARPPDAVACADGESGLADAVLAEIAVGLEQLLAGAGTQRIDIRSLPLTDADRAALRAALGTGEIRAELDVSGPSLVEETGFSGVWWITHKGREGQMLAELIEITYVPEVLSSHTDDVAQGLARLTALFRGQQPGTEDGNERHRD